LVKSYLMGRSQCVIANGALSSFFPVAQGVPQGSILGPFLLSHSVNDISNSIRVSYPKEGQFLFSNWITSPNEKLKF
jgi:Reverse transcriptase (RNA-dependent DNA polymerase)